MRITDEMEVQFLVVRRAALRVEFLVFSAARILAQGRLLALVTVTPGGRETVVHPWIDQFHAAAAASRESGPIATGLVVHLIGQIARPVEQPDQLAMMSETALEIPGHWDVSISLAQMIGVRCNHEIAARGDVRTRGKLVGDSLGQFPA